MIKKKFERMQCPPRECHSQARDECLKCKKKVTCGWNLERCVSKSHRPRGIRFQAKAAMLSNEKKERKYGKEMRERETMCNLHPPLSSLRFALPSAKSDGKTI